MECIILAGGLGTRLQGVIGNQPKCMAPVNGLPFLHYIFNYLEQQSCTRAILSLGHKHEVVLDWLQTETRSFEIDHVIETEPLGTGGGIQLAMQKAITDNVVVLNGDTMFCVDTTALLHVHKQTNAGTTLSLKEMHNFDRYGVVNKNDQGLITSFEEKKHRDTGLINGGVYAINKNYFFSKHLPQKFSFEKDYLEAFVKEGKFQSYISKEYFIDIGIPEDYSKAQEDFKTKLQ